MEKALAARPWLAGESFSLADIVASRCPLMTQSGHERLRVVAVQIDGPTPFRRSKIPAVIASYSA
jgi:glutathione S-transferase